MTDFLRIDLRKGEFHFGRDKRLFTNRDEAETYLVLEYGVTEERARLIINQGAVVGGIELSVVIDSPRIISDGTVGEIE